jgi:outer membrane lipoprotein
VTLHLLDSTLFLGVSDTYNQNRLETAMKYAFIWIILVLIGILTGCAVMPKEMTREAAPQRPFVELVQESEKFIGRTVILGGYIVSVENQQNGTKIVAVQAPLGIGQQPKAKDLSKGRLIVEHDGFLDPEVYTKDRVITVGGIMSGSSKTDQSQLPYLYIRIRAQELHLWPIVKSRPDPYWYYDCYPYYHSRRWHHHHPWCW